MSAGLIVLVLRLGLTASLFVFLAWVTFNSISDYWNPKSSKIPKVRFGVHSSNSRIRAKLLLLAGVFLFLYSLILSLSPAVRAHAWQVTYKWKHWIGFSIWVITVFFIEFSYRKQNPNSDPFLFPIAAFLTGWGILTIYRLDSNFGLRQSIWLIMVGLIFIYAVNHHLKLDFLYKYKYVWLIGGLIITSATIFFGTDPGGGNVKAWLGCCGFYFQPSEPLKLLLIIFLAAYFYENQNRNVSILRLITPTVIILGLSIILLIIQRDLGTASILIFIYTIMIYFRSGKKRILLIFGVGVLIFGLSGYFFSSIIHQRVDAWLNPWLDPSGKSFQIVQSIMAVANGGFFGRGPGLGSPGLVPVSISDFIYVAIGEETGLLGTFGLLSLLFLFIFRIILLSIHSKEDFSRAMTIGFAAYFGGQSILIIGGNIGLVPLTGVTLPFLSYGGSSLLTSFIALFFLINTSADSHVNTTSLFPMQQHFLLFFLFSLSIVTIIFLNSWWAIWKRPEILLRTDNFRRSIAELYVKRGSILDTNLSVIDDSEERDGNFARVYYYSNSGSVVGYTNFNFGQSGFEAAFDSYLRGINGHSNFDVWWNNLIFGQPPPGVDIRLGLDLELQKFADTLLGENRGAIVLLNSASGQIMVMSSHPTFNPAGIEDEMQTLLQDTNSPLLNRAVQGSYPINGILNLFYETYGMDGNAAFSDPNAMNSDLGFYSVPLLSISGSGEGHQNEPLRVNPLQVALSAAAYSNHGIRPVPQLVTGLYSKNEGWQNYPAEGHQVRIFSAAIADKIANSLRIENGTFWSFTDLILQLDSEFSWVLGGTGPDYEGVPLTAVVLLENNDTKEAENICQQLLVFTAYH